MKMPKSLSRAMARALLAMVAFIVAALVVEGAARLAGYRPDVPLTEPHNYFGWRLVPNNTWSMRGGVSVQSNSHGFRDREFPYAKPSGMTRVLLLGDSMAQGVEVPEEATFAKRLEQSLNKGRGPLELINAGMGGFGTVHELLFYELEGARYQPDVVLLAFFMGNDVYDNSERILPMGTPGKPQAPYFVLAGGDLRLENYPCRCEPLQSTARGWSGVRRSIRRRSAAYVAISPAVIQFAPSAAAWLGRVGVMGTLSGQPSWLTRDGIPLLFYNFSAEPSPEWDEGWAITSSLLGRLRERVSSAGGKLLVAGIPTREQVHPELWNLAQSRYPNLRNHRWDLEQPDRLLAAAVANAGATYTSMLAPMRDEAQKSHARLFFDHADEAHLNEHGHALIAAALHDTVAALISSQE